MFFFELNSFHQDYIIRLKIKTDTITIARRYSEFLRLHKEVITRDPTYFLPRSSKESLESVINFLQRCGSETRTQRSSKNEERGYRNFSRRSCATRVFK